MNDPRPCSGETCFCGKAMFNRIARCDDTTDGLNLHYDICPSCGFETYAHNKPAVKQERYMEWRNKMDAALILSQRLSEDKVVADLLKQWTGYENLKRVQAFDAIESERQYQKKLNPNDVKMSIEAELLLLEEYIGLARTTWTQSFGDDEETPTRHFFRKIAGIAVRAMENHGALRRAK